MSHERNPAVNTDPRLFGRYRDNLLESGRDLREELNALILTGFVAMSGFGASFWAKLNSEDALWGNLLTLITILFIVFRMAVMLVDAYFKTESHEIREQRLQLREAEADYNDAKEEFEEIAERLEQERATTRTKVRAFLDAKLPGRNRRKY